METKVFVFPVEGFSFFKFYKKEAKPVQKCSRGFAVLFENRLPVLQAYSFLGEVNKLFANLLKHKQNIKVSVGIKSRKCLLTSCVLDSLTSVIEYR